MHCQLTFLLFPSVDQCLGYVRGGRFPEAWVTERDSIVREAILSASSEVWRTWMTSGAMMACSTMSSEMSS